MLADQQSILQLRGNRPWGLAGSTAREVKISAGGGGAGGRCKCVSDRSSSRLLACKAEMLSTGGQLGGCPSPRREKAATKWLSGWLAGITEMGDS